MTLPPIDLPWPDKDLSPNARVHWGRKSRKTVTARNAAIICTRAAGIRRLDWRGVNVSVVYHPPDRRPRDMDNLVASLKAPMDGISVVIGIDDRHFIPTYSLGEPVKGGLVRVTLSEAQPVIVESTR